MSICKTPDTKKTASTKGMASCTLPAFCTDSAMMTADTTVIGAVGPLICTGVPPNSAAKKPRAMAPYKPAMAPSSVCAPKASAKGSATMPAVTPPKRSPRRCLRSNPVLNFMVETLQQNYIKKERYYCTSPQKPQSPCEIGSRMAWWPCRFVKNDLWKRLFTNK